VRRIAVLRAWIAIAIPLEMLLQPACCVDEPEARRGAAPAGQYVNSAT
jgi:hypothetical protein